jgi:hypothetical protein
MTLNDYYKFLRENYGLDEINSPSLLDNVTDCITNWSFVTRQVVTVSDLKYTDEELLDLREWCTENCTGKFSTLFSNVDWFFENDTDAMLFKLTWR